MPLKGFQTKQGLLINWGIPKLIYMCIKHISSHPVVFIREHICMPCLFTSENTLTNSDIVAIMIRIVVTCIKKLKNTMICLIKIRTRFIGCFLLQRCIILPILGGISCNMGYFIFYNITGWKYQIIETF